MTIEQLKILLQHYHLKPNFTYGQNFLLDEVVLEDVVEAAHVSSSDLVLEIGPGIGNLTRRLCERAGFVLAVEKDPKFLPVLKSIKKEYSNFRFEIGDVLEYDFQQVFKERIVNRQQATGVPTIDCSLVPSRYKVVANIPYYVTGKILQVLMTAQHKPESVTLLVQKEVAENIVAGPGKLSILAISVQLYGDPAIVQIVPASRFYPSPKVDSAIVSIAVHGQPKFEMADEKKFFKIVKACFAGKRKQLHNSLQNNLHLSPVQVVTILDQLKINPTVRPQELSIQNWIDLSQLIS